MPIVWDDVLAALKSIEESETPEASFKALRQFVGLAGGTSLLIGQIANPVITGQPIQSFGWSDWPEAYLAEWTENDYVIHDPITHLAVRATDPFEWADAYAQGTSFGQEILDKAKEFGLVDGLSIPIRTDFLPLGIVSIGYTDPMSPETIEFLELVSIHAYTRAKSFDSNLDASVLSPLSKREVDVLTLTAAGKTTWEISIILGIADTTVKSHIRNIISKMGTANKTQAVIKGIQTGQIIL